MSENESKKDSEKKKGIKQRIKQSAKEIFVCLFEGVENFLIDLEKNPYQSVSVQEYAKRMNASSDFRNHIYYLEKQGLIKTFLKNNEKFAELTDKGFKKIVWHKLGELPKHRPKIWDKKFRLVIFDVPEKKKTTRDIIRRKLEEMGFEKIQESVFVYPFDCKKEIDALCFFTCSKEYLSYLIVDIAMGEDKIIDHFLNKNVLSLKDLM
ncbi:MAG: CRISPR-associated endonuclease Cas2 [Patescibacteria group bacterium]|jgi:ribosomal protein S25